jgi:hypothetical protein
MATYYNIENLKFNFNDERKLKKFSKRDLNKLMFTEKVVIMCEFDERAIKYEHKPLDYFVYFDKYTTVKTFITHMDNQNVYGRFDGLENQYGNSYKLNWVDC